ncbi:ankyrin repeat domain-containing protein 55-like [Haliotis rubra]|uniref:ankyrin repeat domain-containing protein 55-like n=1 Tax=Haliotis rubra TaxID=36100 RepID=UPI001EE58686|nr:ankyrin repeat domain-containing protein 55-like [Haliotis rubra]
MDFGESDISRPSGKENDGDSDLPLVHQAAAQGDIDLLVEVVQQDPSMLELQDAEGFTPLTHAVQSKQLRGVKRLIKMGANINAQDNLGRTCLSIAAYQGWHEGVVCLLRNGAKKTSCDKFGRTPLHAATYDTDRRSRKTCLLQESIVHVYYFYLQQMTALHWAAFHGRPTHLEDLIARQADIFAQDIDGKTSMHWAAQNGSKKCCDILATSTDGFELINLADHSGKTAVHFSAAAGHAEIVQLLSGFPGCDLEALDPDDRTPLHWAAATGQTDCVKTLLSLNVSPNPVDAEGGTPLEYARQSSHTECENLLVKKLGRRFSRNNSKENQTSGVKGGGGRFGFIKNLFGKKNTNSSNVTSNKGGSQNNTSPGEANGTTTVNNPTVPSEQPNHSVDTAPVAVPTICVHEPTDNKPKRGKKRNSKKSKRNLMSESADHNLSSENIADTPTPSGGKGGNSEYRDETRRRSVSPRPLSPLNGVSMSLPSDSELDHSVPPPRVPRRSHSLQPLPDRPTLKLPEGPSPSTSPSVSPRLLGSLENMESPVSPRGGSLGPLRGHKPRPDILVNSRVASLQKERTGANRTPTPPPSDVDSKILNINPSMSPRMPDQAILTPGRHRKPKRRSSLAAPETEFELNCFPTGRMLDSQDTRLEKRGSVSPLATRETTSARRRPSEGSLYS